MKVSKNSLQIVAGILCAVSATVVLAQVSKAAPVSPVRRGDPPPSDPSQKGAIDNEDRQIMETMARAGVAEVEAGKLAESKSSNPQVKQFARQMVESHGAANRDLQALAIKKGVKLPAELDDSDREAIDEAKRLQGAQFDEAYVNQAGLKDHAEARQVFENASKKARDPDLRAYADKGLPMVEHHYQEAQKLAQSMGQKTSQADSTTR